jgi:predicted nucleotidyltransferase
MAPFLFDTKMWVIYNKPTGIKMNGKNINKQDVLTYLGEFKQKNREKYHIVKLGLFGSFTRGDVHDHSDIDIAVELEKPRMFDIVGIKQDLEAAFSRSVDIVRLRQKMNPFLKNRIEKEGIFV